MFFFRKWSIAKENAAKAAAISKSQAVIEFGLDGTVITANENFLNTLGYMLAEIQGKHHSMFVETSERSSDAYRDFWAKLNQGETQSAEYKRIEQGRRRGLGSGFLYSSPGFEGKPDKSYRSSRPISPRKRSKPLENEDQVSAIERSQAVVAFNLDGTIITANKNFLNAMGYTLGEVQGKHDGMFVEPSERSECCLSRTLGQAQSRRVSIG